MRTSTSAHVRREVIRRELAWHEEEQAAQRRRRIDRLLYGPPAFDGIIRAGIEFLAGRPGERVLDLGCGEGKETAELAAHGLRVIAVDLSLSQLTATRRALRRRLPAANVDFVQANAEELPFAPGGLRLVYGKAVLHHLDLGRAAAETGRVLAKNGRATFAEPLADHPLFRLGRALTPRLRTHDERPMPLAELGRFAAEFRSPQCMAFFLLAPLAYFVRLLPAGEGFFRGLHAFLTGLDRTLLSRFPILERWAWYTIINVHR